jgi:hypothetical protein
MNKKEISQAGTLYSIWEKSADLFANTNESAYIYEILRTLQKSAHDAFLQYTGCSPLEFYSKGQVCFSTLNPDDRLKGIKVRK